MQLETLYSVCLITQDSTAATDYVRNFWKDNYVRFLFEREETRNLSRFDKTDDEKATVEFEELGTPLPAGVKLTKIKRFRSRWGSSKRSFIRIVSECSCGSIRNTGAFVHSHTAPLHPRCSKQHSGSVLLCRG